MSSLSITDIHVIIYLINLQTKTHVCLITDYCPGGELFMLLDQQPTKVLKEDAVRYTILLHTEFIQIRWWNEENGKEFWSKWFLHVYKGGRSFQIGFWKLFPQYERVYLEKEDDQLVWPFVQLTWFAKLNKIQDQIQLHEFLTKYFFGSHFT